MPEKTFTTEERALALHILALCAGDSGKASRALAERGVDIAQNTLRRWCNDLHAEEYQRIRHKLEEQIDHELAEDMLALTQDSVRLAQKTNISYEQALESNDTSAAKDLAAAARNLGVNAGIGNTNNRLIRDKPTQLVQQQVSTSELASELARLSPAIAKSLGVLVEVEAEEIKDADVVELEPGPTSAEG